ncbi:MAG TPA: DUF302 domain-containing protein [Actinophytocola sp.]|uniref:DUF302 domain-containing protein n=1 Tax=Actinophytocola sp. TaxID=1872138 RepID=UPI002DB785A9|nr:DUF302 domain-containing protein [Actinophytocola sp.]HEU5474909.1 DUF302 domain-containing protein [Actinophytocola sp.]
MDIGLTARLRLPFTEAVTRTKEALREQGFGVLTEIDVRQTLREKLDENMEDYLILGACNPRLAHRALGVDRQVGLLLPCNVVVRADVTAEGAQTVVEAIDPATMITATDEPALTPVADEAGRLLRAALDTLIRSEL